MGIVVKQFDGVSVTPKDDAVVRDLLFSEYGIFRGCGISFLGVNQIRVASGYMIVKGREVAITEETIAAQLSSNGTKRGRLYIHFDFSNQTTPAQFLTQVADELPALTQEEDANYNDGIFEIELCNYDVSEVAVSNIVESCPIITGGMDLLSTIEEVMANTMPGKGVDALVVGEVIDSLGGVQFGIDGEGNRCYLGADGSLIPFSSGVFELPFSLYAFANNAQAVGTLATNTVHTNKYAIDFTSVNLVQIYASRHASSTSGTLYVAISDEPLFNLSEMQSCEYYKSFTLVAGTTTKPSAFEIDTSALKGKKYINLYSVISGTGNLYMWDIMLN